MAGLRCPPRVSGALSGLVIAGVVPPQGLGAAIGRNELGPLSSGYVALAGTPTAPPPPRSSARRSRISPGCATRPSRSGCAPAAGAPSPARKGTERRGAKSSTSRNGRSTPTALHRRPGAGPTTARCAPDRPQAPEPRRVTSRRSNLPRRRCCGKQRGRGLEAELGQPERRDRFGGGEHRNPIIEEGRDSAVTREPETTVRSAGAGNPDTAARQCPGSSRSANRDAGAPDARRAAGCPAGRRHSL